MNTETKHTPTPWSQFITGKQYHVGIGNFARFDNPVAFVCNQKTCNESVANAELICRAVNAHDALLEAARDAAEIVEHAIQFLRHQKPGREFYPNREGAEATAARLKAAIKLAEGVES